MDPAWEFRALRSTCMAAEPGSTAAAKSQRLLAEAKRIRRGRGTAEAQLAELWATLEELDLRDAGERHLGAMAEARRRRERA